MWLFIIKKNFIYYTNQLGVVLFLNKVIIYNQTRKRDTKKRKKIYVRCFYFFFWDSPNGSYVIYAPHDDEAHLSRNRFIMLLPVAQQKNSLPFCRTHFVFYPEGCVTPTGAEYFYFFIFLSLDGSTRATYLDTPKPRDATIIHCGAFFLVSSSTLFGNFFFYIFYMSWLKNSFGFIYINKLVFFFQLN